MEQSPGGKSEIDYRLGDRIADEVWAGRLGRSISRCYEYVWGALARSVGPHINALSTPAESAYMFGDWVYRNPETARRELRLERRSMSRLDAPDGSVIVWNRGDCGYNSVHGHIEIAVGGGQACSDYCGPIATGCGNPRIYVPVR